MKIFVVPTLFVISILFIPLDAFIFKLPKENRKSIIELEKKVHELKDKMKSSQEELADIRRKVNLTADEGWFVAQDHPMQYLITPIKQTWQKSRKLCQDVGGELATISLVTKETRKHIIKKLDSRFEELSYYDKEELLGDHSHENEGLTWINGGEHPEVAFESEVPYDKGSYHDLEAHCLVLNNAYFDYFDEPCSHKHRALCAKPFW